MTAVAPEPSTVVLHYSTPAPSSSLTSEQLTVKQNNFIKPEQDDFDDKPLSIDLDAYEMTGKEDGAANQAANKLNERAQSVGNTSLGTPPVKQLPLGLQNFSYFRSRSEAPQALGALAGLVNSFDITTLWVDPTLEHPEDVPFINLKSSLCADQRVAVNTLERDLQQAYDDHARSMYAASTLLYFMGGFGVTLMGTCGIIYQAAGLDMVPYSYGINVTTVCLGLVTPKLQRWQTALWERQERIRDQMDILRQIYKGIYPCQAARRTFKLNDLQPLDSKTAVAPTTSPSVTPGLMVVEENDIRAPQFIKPEQDEFDKAYSIDVDAYEVTGADSQAADTHNESVQRDANTNSATPLIKQYPLGPQNFTYFRSKSTHPQSYGLVAGLMHSYHNTTLWVNPALQHLDDVPYEQTKI